MYSMYLVCGVDFRVCGYVNEHVYSIKRVFLSGVYLPGGRRTDLFFMRYLDIACTRAECKEEVKS